jgi:RNA polymerase sigma factor for flagellar operon FliA
MPADEALNRDRNELILEYYPMVRRVAYRMARRYPRSVDVDDLIHIGMLGLIDAVDRYEGDRAESFTAYARIRIQGSIVDEMRKADWVPRSVRDRANAIRNARDTLSKSLGRDPSHAEVASRLGVDEERLTELLRTADIRILVSTEEGGDDDSTVGSTLVDPRMDVDEIVARRHKSSQVRQVLSSLPDRERLIVELYYYRDRNFKEIADVLGVTESRVSQLHTRMKKRFRELLVLELQIS